MPENYVAKFKLPPKAEQDEIIAAAERKIGYISKTIRDEKDFPKPDGRQATGLMHEIFTPLLYFSIKDKRFRSTDKCTGCGDCVSLCPLINIKLEGGRPKYGGNCTHCMACICGCPEKAIEYGGATVKRERYFLKKSAPGLRDDMLIKPIKRLAADEIEEGESSINEDNK
jgi:ferredoxin